MQYIVYDILTGRVFADFGYEPSSSQIPDNHGVLTIEETDFNNFPYVRNGELLYAPAKPTQHHEFDYSVGEWICTHSDGVWDDVRFERDKRLSLSDWTQLPDVPITTRQKWVEYRQALRDITEQPDPFNIDWPEQPT